MQGLLAQDWRLLAFEHLDGVSLDQMDVEEVLLLIISGNNTDSLSFNLGLHV